jgi:hypothetical protein
MAQTPLIMNNIKRVCLSAGNALNQLERFLASDVASGYHLEAVTAGGKRLAAAMLSTWHPRNMPEVHWFRYLYLDDSSQPLGFRDTSIFFRCNDDFLNCHLNLLPVAQQIPALQH